ncbi:MAG: alpha-glucan family phosphorylase [Gemmatimonadota bacterium]|nr:alpha-glucan family phosphorylase [Gemmatimonadota bacterium]
MDTIAYFSMEIGLESAIPTYAGGLGVLAGDTVRAAADLGVPMAAITLAHREGYFRQSLDESGHQREEPATWSPEERLEEAGARATIEVGGRPVAIRAWRYPVRGEAGEVPVYLLDTDLPENADEDRAITDRLYGGDLRDRLRQEAVLGIGGIAVLDALGIEPPVYHLNEGHSALLALPLLGSAAEGGEPGGDGLAAVQRRCVFTTHTPVPAGHDVFPAELAASVLGSDRVEGLSAIGAIEEGGLDMTRLALLASRSVNGVSRRHAQVSQQMFPGREIEAITNGVHAATWTSPPFRELYDRRLPGWRRGNSVLRHAVTLPLDEIAAAHAEARASLLREAEARAGIRLDPDTFTLGFARRATAYKRAGLLFHDLERLERIARDAGPIQVLFAGKAHPADEDGKAMIRRIVEAAGGTSDGLRAVWLPGYDMDLGARMTAGVDVWLNTPRRPLEASGTSGMKAALNGVPSLSVLDGWWIEGHVEGKTGWSIGETWEGEGDEEMDADALYARLEEEVLPLFYRDPEGWRRVTRSTIALNGSFFTAERMVRQYVQRIYRPGGLVGSFPARSWGDLRELS